MPPFPILTFHALDYRESVISFSPQPFESGMARLHRKGYRSLDLIEIADLLRSRTAFPLRSFAMTFDDGYRSVYEQAFPVLQRYKFSATIFLTTGESLRRSVRLPHMEGRSMLSWSEIKEMQRWGIRFGAHTLTHPDLTRLSCDRIEAEVCGSKKVIEDALGDAVSCFAYPYGRYDSRSYDIVRQHFVCACSDRLGLTHARSDLFAIKRVDAYYLRYERGLDRIASPFFPLYIHARNLPRQFRRSFLSTLAKLCAFARS